MGKNGTGKGDRSDAAVGVIKIMNKVIRLHLGKAGKRNQSHEYLLKGHSRKKEGL